MIIGLKLFCLSRGLISFLFGFITRLRLTIELQTPPFCEDIIADRMLYALTIVSSIGKYVRAKLGRAKCAGD